jgi:hypothetical protein
VQDMVSENMLCTSEGLCKEEDRDPFTASQV